MRVLGVDPGITGGLAVVEITDGAAPVLVECIDIPASALAPKNASTSPPSATSSIGTNRSAL